MPGQDTSGTHSRCIIGPSFQLLSNWCSMACAGCGIHVSAPTGDQIVTLGPHHLNNVRRNLRLVKETLDSMGFEYAMVEQSGGEPTHHPQVVEAIGEVFERSVHKIITNGLTSRSIYRYLQGRGKQAFVVLSIDHHNVAFNRVRLGAVHKSRPDRALQTHDMVLENLKLFVKADLQVVVSTIISRWNIDVYLEFIRWLERTYPDQIEAGTLVPIPVSLVSFGKPALGKLNPTREQVDAFEEAVDASDLLTLKRSRRWLFQQLIGHYRNKQRFFEGGEPLDDIELRPSRHPCEIFRYMISFNFQDEEILRPPGEALFEGYSCGVKVLGNIGHLPDPAQMHDRLPVVANRPSNMKPGKKYYRADQVKEYVHKKEAVNNDVDAIEMGGEMGAFSRLRRGMCMLDDFDGVWWPFNMYLQGRVDELALADYWSLFRNQDFMGKLQRVRQGAIQAAGAS